MFHEEDVKQNDMVGYWIITEDSLQRLKDVCHFHIYTNQLDHVIRFKADGTCVYRSFSEFSVGPVWKSEEGMYLGHLERADVSGFWSGGQRASRYWYGWNPTGDRIIDGPYTNVSVVGEGKPMLTCFGGWTLVDFNTTDEGYRTRSTAFDERYHVEFHPNVDAPGGGGAWAWYLGDKNGSLILWQWVWDATPRTVIKFIKVDENTLRLKASTEGPRNHVSTKDK